MNKIGSIEGKQRIKILYIRPPYSYWPLVNQSDNCLAPLNFLCLAAYVREHVPNVEQKIIDCMHRRIGFGTLARILEEEQADIVGVGDMIC
ncbi:MAG TPA: hypothetical protein PK468_04075, partial [Candidatus Hydrogenedentes bacterium]|nr:hypothetical protein [Candidatus Hydrogenedentota bacterium]